MKARRCQGCGAPLPASDDHHGTLTCTFCGMANEIASGRPAATVVHVDLRQQSARAFRAIRILTIAGVVGTVAWIVFTLGAVFWMARTELAEVPRAVAGIAGPAGARPMAEIATAGAGWHEVQVEPPPGGWGSFDPVKQLPWTMAIAQSWAPDAALTRIDLFRAAADGTVNLAGGPDDKVGYRFVSAARVAEWARAADTNASAETAHSLMMQIVGQKVTASIQTGRPSDDVKAPPEPPDSLALGDVLARARKFPRFVDRPFYSGYLIHLQSEGWVWYFQTLSGRDSIPRVRARDARPFPYR